jgi:hypothetical protein
MGVIQALTLSLVALFISTSSASAEELPPKLDPVLSLTGDCTALAPDPVPDPSCPYPPPPGGPKANFFEPRAITVDSFGNEYVASFDGRIDVFDDEGKFITEFPASFPNKIAVDSTGTFYLHSSIGDVFRYIPSVYEPEVGKVAYGDPPVNIIDTGFGGGIAIDASNDHLFLKTNNAVKEFESAAEGNDLIETTTHEKLGIWSESIAIDSQRRRLYTNYCASPDGTSECGVVVFSADAPHVFLEELDGSNTPAGKFITSYGGLSIAVDETTGHFFVQDVVGGTPKRIYEFDENYNFFSQLASVTFNLTSSPVQIAVSNGENASGDASNRRYLFVPTLHNGRAVAFEPAGVLAPEILEVSVANIGETEAELSARIDPEGADTDYVFEYVTQDAFDESGFTGAAIAREGTISEKSGTASVNAILNGLTPGEAYRFRVLAENDGGKASEEGNEGSFTTYADTFLDGASCANAGLRVGASAALPDCRAYELVTPPETTGRRPKGSPATGIFVVEQVSPVGDAVSFMIEGGSLPGTTGAGSFEGDPYLSSRTSSGWTSTIAGPSGGEATLVEPDSVSLDQGYSFWTGRNEGPLVIDGLQTKYLHYPDGHSELIGRGSLGSDPRVRGVFIAEDGTHVIFMTDNVSSGEWKAVQLEPDAPPSGTETLYDRTIDPVTGAEETHVVSLLPGEITPAGRPGSHVVTSADGEGVAFEMDKLYLRKNNEVTYEIGEDVDDAFGGTGFAVAGISEGGERIFYLEGSDLFAFDTSSEEVIPFSGSGDVTVVNVARDGSRAYFLSPSVLDGENPNGAFAQPGKQNLYLSNEGEISFIATVTDRDVDGAPSRPGEPPTGGLGLWIRTGKQNAESTSRLNPDGSVLLFESRANITGYDSGEFPQIYRYDSTAGRLHCISCIPTKTAANGGASLQRYVLSEDDPAPLSRKSLVTNITPDGKRVFFESKEALVSRDTNGLQDVYEWEEEGVGSCEQPGGCVYLITSGRSGEDQYLYGHSRNGRDVFFTTDDVLTGFDIGPTTSIYDARVNGGFASPTPSGECLGGTCQPLVSAPDDPTPTSASFRGQGNVKEPRKARCPSGKRKVKRQGKSRCVKKSQRQRKRANSKSRRTSK